METKTEIRIGSRESKLAVIQSEIVQRHLQEKYPEGDYADNDEDHRG